MRLKKVLSGALLALSLGVGALATFSPSPVLAQSAVLLPNGKQQFLDSNGAPLAGGSVGFYVPPATLTPKTTWLDAARATPNSNPVTLDSSGEATIYGVGTYRQIVKDALGATIWDAQTSGLGGSLYGGVSTGTANAQSLAASDFAGVDGSIVSWIAGFTNTGSLTLDAGFGAKSVVKITPSGAAVLTGGEVVANGTYSASWSVSNNRFTLLNTTSFIPATSIPVTFNGSISATVTTNNLVISLLTASGATPSLSSPVTVPFLTATGSFSYVNVTTATTFTIPAACNLGDLAVTTPRIIIVYARNSAGGVTLGASSSLGKAFDVSSAPAISTASCVNFDAIYGPAGGLLSVASTVVGRVDARNSGATWLAAGLQVWNNSPDVIAINSAAIQRGPGVSSSGTVVMTPGIYNGSGPTIFPVPINYWKHFELVLEDISTSGVSPLVINNLCGSFPAISYGLINTLSGAAVASTVEPAGANIQLTGAMVAANNVSGVVDYYFDIAQTAPRLIVRANLVSSGNIQWITTAEMTGCTDLTDVTSVQALNGTDTFDNGRAYLQASY